MPDKRSKQRVFFLMFFLLLLLLSLRSFERFIAHPRKCALIFFSLAAVAAAAAAAAVYYWIVLTDFRVRKTTKRIGCIHFDGVSE